MNVALVAPEDTVTLPGTVAFPLLLASMTVNPPPGAAPLRLTVHKDDPGAFTLVGLHDRLLGDTEGATRLTFVFTEMAFDVAVTVAVALLLTVPAVAVNVPLLALVAIDMLPGTVSTPLLLDNVTDVVLSAALLSVTVQVELCDVVKEEGEQLTDDNCAGVGATIDKLVVRETLLAVAVKVAD